MTAYMDMEDLIKTFIDINAQLILPQEEIACQALSRIPGRNRRNQSRKDLARRQGKVSLNLEIN